MATLTELVVKVNGDLSGLQRALDRSTSAIRRFGSEVTSAGRSLTIGLTLPIVGLGASATQAAAQMDSLRRGLTSVTGSASATKEQLARLEDVAKLPGLGFREAIQGSIRLQAAGLSAALSERSLRAFGNALATVGSGKAELDGVTRALTQIANKTKISAEEINQLAERVPQIRQAMIAAFGTADTEIIQKMKVAPKAFIEALVAQLEKLPKVTGGAANSFENFSDALFRARAAIGEKLLPAILPLIEGLTRVLEGVRTISPETVRWGIAIAGVAAVLGPAIIVVGSLTSALAVLAGALSVSLLPLIVVGGPILIGLGALAALFLKNKLEALAAGDAVDRFKMSLVGMDSALLSTGIQQRTTALVNLEGARTNILRQLTVARAELDTLRRQAPASLRETFTGQAQFEDLGRRRRMGRLQPGFLPTPEGFDPEDITRAQQQVTRLESLLTGLGSEKTRVLSEFRQMGEQFNASMRAAANASTPLVSTAARSGDKLAGVVDGLSDRLREFRALAQFGVPSINFLPQDAQDQLRLVNTLAADLDTLTDGLNRLRAAGRAAPEGMEQGIASLRRQIAAATQELEGMARRWTESRDQLFGRVDIRLGTVQVAPGGINIPTGSLPKGMRDLEASVKDAAHSIKATVGVIISAGQELRASIGQGVANVAAGSSEFASNAISMGSKMMSAGQSLAAAGPAALAFAAAMEITRGAFDVIGPAINALTLPLRIMGEIVGMLIVPVLRILWGPLKLLGIVVSYIGEVIAKVAGAIANAIGSLVKGIGKLVNKLPGSPGDPLVKAGQAMIDLGKQFKNAAKDMEERRKELQGLSWDDAMNGVDRAIDRLEESLTNVPPLFNLALRRLQAATGVGAAAGSVSVSPPPLAPDASPATPPPPPSAPVVIVIDGDGNPRGADSDTRALLRRLAGRLDYVSDAQARVMAGVLRMAS